MLFQNFFRSLTAIQYSLNVSNNNKWRESLSFGALSIHFPLLICNLTTIRYSLSVSYNGIYTENLTFGAFSLLFQLVNCNLTAIQHSLTVSNNDKWAESLSFDAFSILFPLVNCNYHYSDVNNEKTNKITLICPLFFHFLKFDLQKIAPISVQINWLFERIFFSLEFECYLCLKNKYKQGSVV